MLALKESLKKIMQFMNLFPKMLLGTVCATSGFLFFSILTLPMIVYRMVVATLATYFKPDLDSLVNGHSALFFSDYVANTPPRSNITVTNVFQNPIKLKEVRDIVLERWIKQEHPNTAMVRPDYKKFQQCPVKWMGIPFWKNVSHSFSVEKHVRKLFNEETMVTTEMLDEAIEKLLNSRFPRNQSPWGLYVINNYQPKEGLDGTQSVVIFKIHHILADGYGIISALVEGLFDDQCLSKMNLPKPVFTKRSLSEMIMSSLQFPIKAFIELSTILAHNFINHPWKVPDERKKWHQFLVRHDPIPIQMIKDIKNTFGVSFSSVLLSAISSAVNLMMNSKDNFSSLNDHQDSMMCYNVLPVPFRASGETLSNKITAAIMSLPIQNHDSPSKRLLAIDKMIKEVKHAAHPYFFEFLSDLVGIQFPTVCQFFSNHNAVPLAMTNFPGLPHIIKFKGNPLLDSSFEIGGFTGAIGIVVSVISHGKQIRIGIAAEEGLMSRKQVNQMSKYLNDEIHLLHKFARSC